MENQPWNNWLCYRDSEPEDDEQKYEPDPDEKYDIESLEKIENENNNRD